MRTLCGTILAATACAAFGDVLTPAAPGDVKVLGRPGELFESALNARVFSACAQGPMYDEAENAFAPGAAGYQWLKDGEVVEGATGQTLEVAYGKGGTTNVYQCVSHYATFGYGVSDEAHVVNERIGLIISVR